MKFLSRLFLSIRAAFRPIPQERDWAAFNQHTHRRTNTLEPDWAAINSYSHWPTDTSLEPDWAVFNQHSHC
ncbi:MAG: hypothetical protein ACXWPK_00140 [Isosphaeraceae bacterium]